MEKIKSFNKILQETSDTENQMLTSLSKSSNQTIESSIEILSCLFENLKLYKQIMTELLSGNLDTDINCAITPQFQSHTLPGVVSLPYQHNIKHDTEANTSKEKILTHKRMIFRMILKNRTLLFQSLKSLENMDIHFEEFLEIARGNIDLNIQPHKLDKKHITKSTNIKLSVDKEID